MEVLDENSGLLSNYEVLQVIQESLAALKEGTKVERQAQQNLHTVAFEANEYLQSGPSRRQTPEVVRAFLLAISKFPLTKAEKLQLLNVHPEGELGLQLIVEDCDKRLSEAQIQDIIEVISTTLPAAPVQGVAVAGEEEAVAMETFPDEVVDAEQEEAQPMQDDEPYEAEAEEEELVVEGRGGKGSEDELGE